MKFDDVAGRFEVSAQETKQFLMTWFHPEDKIVIVGRRDKKSGNLDTLSQSVVVKDFIQDLNDDSLHELIFGSDGSKWNLYCAVAPVKGEVSLQRRGTEDNVAYLPGVYADIDIKPKGFTSQEEILAFLKSLPLEPTMVVGSGSGGVHAYWRLNWDEKGTKDIIEYWWSFLDESAGEDRGIDKLIDMTRILRIPGSVYFPKEDSGAKIGSVEILECSQLTYSAEEIVAVSTEAYEKKQQKRAKVIDREGEIKLNVSEMIQSAKDGLAGNFWRFTYAAAYLEDYVNDHMSWDEILVPHGWNFLRKLRDGSDEWARPGRNERSAVVGYEGSPVMSLLSMSEDTGLADLKDARIPLTKYRVLMRLTYEDNINVMVHDLLDRISTIQN